MPNMSWASRLEFAWDSAKRRTASLQISVEYFKKGKLDLNKEMVLFCAGGLRSALAAKTLIDMGFKNVSHVEGGFHLMKQSGFDIK